MDVCGEPSTCVDIHVEFIQFIIWINLQCVNVVLKDY